MASAQALSEVERRTVAAWAADTAERVLPIFESAVAEDARPREAIGRALRGGPFFVQHAWVYLVPAIVVATAASIALFGSLVILVTRDGRER